MEGWGSNYTLCAQGTKRRLITESRTGAHDAGRGRQEKGEPQHRPPRGQWCPTRGGAAARVGKTRARKLEEKKASVRGLENALEGRAAASAAATSNGALARVGAAAHVGKTRARKLAEKRASARGLDNAFQRRHARYTLHENLAWIPVRRLSRRTRLAARRLAMFTQMFHTPHMTFLISTNEHRAEHRPRASIIATCPAILVVSKHMRSRKFVSLLHVGFSQW